MIPLIKVQKIVNRKTVEWWLSGIGLEQKRNEELSFNEYRVFVSGDKWS